MRRSQPGFRHSPTAINSGAEVVDAKKAQVVERDDAPFERPALALFP